MSGGDSLKNIYGVTFFGEDTVAAGDNGFIYSFRADKVADFKFKAEICPISCIGVIEKGNANVIMTISDECVISFWEGQDLSG